MSKRLTQAFMTLMLVLTPMAAQSQVSASVSLGFGLFDGAGIGMTASHWAPHSIYRPGFRVGFGASVGIGVGVGFGFGHGYGRGWAPYRPYASGYIGGNDCWDCWDAYHGYDPYYCTMAWGCYDPYYTNPWGPYYGSGFHISLGLGWRHYRRPVFFDPWWGHTGYLARWRPVWGYDPGWWYYNDPWYVTPGYARVAYVVPAQRVIRTVSPRGGYRTTTFKESPRGALASTGGRRAQPRNGAAGVASPEPRNGALSTGQRGRGGAVATRPPMGGQGNTAVARPSRGARAGGSIARPSSGSRPNGSAVPGSGMGRPGSPSVGTRSGAARAPSNPGRVARPSDRIRGGVGARNGSTTPRPSARTPSARGPNRTPSARTPSARGPNRTPSARTPSARAPSGRSGVGGRTVRPTPQRSPGASSGRSSGARVAPRTAPRAKTTGTRPPTVRRSSPPTVKRRGGGGT